MEQRRYSIQNLNGVFFDDHLSARPPSVLSQVGVPLQEDDLREVVADYFD
jgi:hypothetical protein